MSRDLGVKGFKYDQQVFQKIHLIRSLECLDYDLGTVVYFGSATVNMGQFI